MTGQEASIADYPYHWRVRARLPHRYGQPCKVSARGALNSIRVEFPDGEEVVTSGNYIRRRAPKAHP